MGHRAKATCSSPTGCQRWLLFATVTLWLQVLGAPGLLQEGCGVVGGGVPAPFLVPGCTHFISVAGSHSGSVKLWKCGEGFRKLEPLCDIPLVWGGEVPQWWEAQRHGMTAVPWC